MFYCMLYFTCDRSFNQVADAAVLFSLSNTGMEWSSPSRNVSYVTCVLSRFSQRIWSERGKERGESGRSLCSDACDRY